ncbi:MAG TPA: MarR family winged helix-turn-helix transcriptional regulator [Erythrobacter sp.]|nr:MarR family winged helix-turn-helix transcriptional regulator [Erythrobacter sp.]
MDAKATPGGRLADFLPYQLSVTSNAVSSLIAERYRVRFGLKIPEWRVMAVLGDAGTVTQRALTDATLMDKVAVNRACKVLEDRGLIARRPNTDDGRSHLLELTAEGRAIHGEVMPLAREIEAEIFSTLGEAECEQFRELLSRVFRQAESMRPATRS